MAAKEKEADKLGEDLAAITEERDILKAENTELKKKLKDSDLASVNHKDDYDLLQSKYEKLQKELETKSSKRAASKTAEKLIHLQRGTVNEIETTVLTEAAWNNLPKAHKKDWKIKKPDELNS